jgi:hypothetical protein
LRSSGTVEKMAKSSRYSQIVRHLGWGWILFRIRYALSARFGLLQLKTPPRVWENVEATECALPFLNGNGIEFNLWESDEVGEIASDSHAIESADRLLEGHFPFYSHQFLRLTFPPDWHQNPFSGERVPSDVHWSKLSDFAYGDIKHVWELSRFSWVYVLCRAYVRTQDRKYTDAFQVLVLDWMEMNPPNMGANWRCGQEVVLRLVALAWGLRCLCPNEGFSRAFDVAVARLFAFSGARVEANLSYALSQKNNHGLNEAAGLWMIAVLYPGLNYAERWKRKGRKWLERQAAELIYADGSCSQNSLNYQRLMVDMLAWCVWLSRQTGESLAPGVSDAMRRAAEFLDQCQDEQSGRVPNYGANDGALLFPLTDADYGDFRPSLQVAFFLLNRKQRYPPGAHDEALFYFFGKSAMETPLEVGDRIARVTRDKVDAEDTGCYTLRGDNGFVFFRCGNHIHRPSHADQLHVDIFWKGENVAADPGTYSYNADPPFHEGFAGTRFHNTVTVDGLDQMDKASRFLWLPWATGKVIDRGIEQGRFNYLVGVHDGYRRLKDPVTHRRKVMQIEDNGFLVIDRVLVKREIHQIDLRWLLPSSAQITEDDGQLKATIPGNEEPVFVSVAADKECTFSTTAGDEKSGEGWISRYYMHKEKATSCSATVLAKTVTFVSWLGASDLEPLFLGENIVKLDMGTTTVEISSDF